MASNRILIGFLPPEPSPYVVLPKNLKIKFYHLAQTSLQVTGLSHQLNLVYRVTVLLLLHRFNFCLFFSHFILFFFIISFYFIFYSFQI